MSKVVSLRHCRVQGTGSITVRPQELGGGPYFSGKSQGRGQVLIVSCVVWVATYCALLLT